MKVETKEIFLALKKEIAAVLPSVHHFFGQLEEKHKLPGLLYLVTYDGRRKFNRTTAEVTKEIQLVYFGTKDTLGRENYKERLQAETALQGVLDRFYLTVGDRHLKYSYEIKDADDQMAVYLTFKFLEEAADPRDEANAGMEAAGSVSFRKIEEKG